MSREVRVAIYIFILGLIGVTTYWFYPVDREEPYSIDDEEIILPKFDRDFYRKIPEVREYIDELKRAIAKGEPLPLDSSELDSGGEKAQEIALRDREFLADMRDSKGRTLHNDIMTSRPAIISVMDSRTADICRDTTCYQVA